MVSFSYIFNRLSFIICFIFKEPTPLINFDISEELKDGSIFFPFGNGQHVLKIGRPTLTEVFNDEYLRISSFCSTAKILKNIAKTNNCEEICHEAFVYIYNPNKHFMKQKFSIASYLNFYTVGVISHENKTEFIFLLL